MNNNQPSSITDEAPTVMISSHVLIRDRKTGQTLVNKRGS
jgi:hypothetical protein